MEKDGEEIMATVATVVGSPAMLIPTLTLILTLIPAHRLNIVHRQHRPSRRQHILNSCFSFPENNLFRPLKRFTRG